MSDADHSADDSSPQSLVESAYRLISFGPGSEPGWNSFRRLFAEKSVLALRLFPGDPAISVMSLDEYVVRQVNKEMKEAGYEERPIRRRFIVTGDIAEARVHFQMVFGPDEVHDALDVFQMVRVDGHWKIVSIVSEVGATSMEAG